MRHLIIVFVLMGLLSSSVGFSMEGVNLTPFQQMGACAKEKTMHLQKYNIHFILGSLVAGGGIALASHFSHANLAPLQNALAGMGDVALFMASGCAILTACGAINKKLVNRRFAAREQQVVNDLQEVQDPSDSVMKKLRECDASLYPDERSSEFRESLGLSGRFCPQEHFLFSDYMRRAQGIPEKIGIFHRIARALDFCY